MELYMLCVWSEDIEKLGERLGYSRVLFEGRDFVYSEARSLKEAVRLVQKAEDQGVISVCRWKGGDAREVVEKTGVGIIVGLEGVAARDSLHQVRAGMNQVIGPIMARRKIAVMFSVNDALENQGFQHLSRIRFNMKLAYKYGVETIRCCMSESVFGLRSARDVENFFKVVGC